MRYRQFGNTDLQVSEIGCGTWAMGGDAMIGTTAIGWGPADDQDSAAALRASLEAGINFFDTADIYGLGHSEELLGRYLPKDVLVATKGGNVSRNEQFTVDYTKAHLLQACEQSLRRLKREVIDFYQLHTARLQHLENGATCIAAMQQLQQEGKIRYWGISLNTFEPAPEADLFMQNQWGQGFQLVLNIINQKALSLVKKAGEKGYGIIARMPLQFGLLTGKFDEQSRFAATDHRRNRLTPEVIHASNQALAPIWELCGKYGITKTQLALSYILSYAEVSTIIPGIRTKEQVQLNTEGLITLADEDRERIEQAGATTMVDLMDLIRQQG